MRIKRVKEDDLMAYIELRLECKLTQSAIGVGCHFTRDEIRVRVN